MTASRIDKLRAIVEAMTPGPWEAESHGPLDAWIPQLLAAREFLTGDAEMTEPDARGIVALRNCAPELLAVVEAAERRKAAAEAVRIAAAAWRATGGAPIAMREPFSLAVDAAERELRAAIEAEDAALDALDARIAALPDGGERS